MQWLFLNKQGWNVLTVNSERLIGFPFRSWVDWNGLEGSPPPHPLSEKEISHAAIAQTTTVLAASVRPKGLSQFRPIPNIQLAFLTETEYSAVLTEIGRFGRKCLFRLKNEYLGFADSLLVQFWPNQSRNEIRSSTTRSRKRGKLN